MKTVSLNIFNSCVPCHNYCRYCLLSWDNTCLGIEYERSMEYARNFYNWLKMKRKDMNFMYYFGYSMEHPDLLNAIKFMQDTNSPGGEFLQLDGLKMRSIEELRELFCQLKEAGIKMVNFTFYGTKDFHDKFAGRKADYELMMNSLNIALEYGIEVEVGIPILKDNMLLIDNLISELPTDRIKLHVFIPHSGGRGKYLQNSKITVEDYEELSDNTKKYLNRNLFCTPNEWLNHDISKHNNRILTLSLLPTNIDHFENQSFEETINELEKMDEDYYSVIPDFRSLLEMYANGTDTCLYSKKDLYMLYRKRYIEENQISIIDMTDERFSNSLRY